MAVSLEKKTMLRAFRQKKAPTMFLASWFKTSPQDIFKSLTCVIDVKRNNEMIAVDVVRGTDGVHNKNNRFTTKEYAPPFYDEYFSYFADELNKRMPGNHEYENPDYIPQLIALMTDDQVISQEKILRAIEKMAADTLLTGKIVLINGDTIDFKQKTTHNFDAAIDWDEASTAKPWVELEKAATLNRKDGKTTSKIVVAGENAMVWLLDATKMQTRLNFRRADLVDIKPPGMNADGAVFHGMITAGAYNLQLWTYPQFYEIPTDAELGLPSGTVTNAGTTQPYIPLDRVLVLPEPGAIDLRLVYAGIPTVVNQTDPAINGLGLPAVPATVRTDFHPYALLDTQKSCIKAGVKSSPLTIPTQIDGWCEFDAKAS